MGSIIEEKNIQQSQQHPLICTRPFFLFTCDSKLPRFLRSQHHVLPLVLPLFDVLLPLLLSLFPSALPVYPVFTFLPSFSMCLLSFSSLAFVVPFACSASSVQSAFSLCFSCLSCFFPFSGLFRIYSCFPAFTFTFLCADALLLKLHMSLACLSLCLSSPSRSFAATFCLH